MQRDALPKAKESLDILLVSTTGAQPVQVYRDVESVEAIYGPDGPTPNAKIVRKAKTLLNQGKTTLATSLVNKFKIVGFKPPNASPALPATFILDFTEVEFAEAIPADKTLWVKIGGDDKALVEVTTTAAVSSAAGFAGLFANTSFTKGGKTYTALADAGVVTYTATTPGAADSIPEQINVYANEIMTEELTLLPSATVEFNNGVNAKTAGDALIDTIQRVLSLTDTGPTGAFSGSARMTPCIALL